MHEPTLTCVEFFSIWFLIRLVTSQCQKAFKVCLEWPNSKTPIAKFDPETTKSKPFPFHPHGLPAALQPNKQQLLEDGLYLLFSQFFKLIKAMTQIHFILTCIQTVCLWRPFCPKDFCFSVSLGGLTCFLGVQSISEHPIEDWLSLVLVY